MIELAIIIFICVLGFFITFITSIDNFIDKEKDGINVITKKGTTFLIVSFISIILYVFQFEKNEITAKREKEHTDSLYQKRVEESNKKIIKSFADGLAIYGLKYDSALRKIEFLVRDSTRRTIINIEGDEPFLSLCKEDPIVLKKSFPDHHEFDLNICNSLAPSKNIQATVYVVSLNYSEHFSFIKAFNLFQSNAQMDANSHTVQQLIVPAIEKFKICYFLVKGSWTNLTAKKKYNIGIFKNKN
jgi:hypothetical protein